MWMYEAGPPSCLEPAQVCGGEADGGEEGGDQRLGGVAWFAEKQFVGTLACEQLEAMGKAAVMGSSCSS